MQRSAKRARTGLALAAGILLIPLLWVVVAGAAGSDAGDVDIVPDLGDSETAFTLDLPDGAACTGDSAVGGYTITSFMVRGDVDLTTLTFDPLGGPLPLAEGASFRQPLYEVGSGTPFTAVQTANADTPGGPGVIIGVPQFDLVSAGFEPGDIPADVYKVGIACVKGPPDSDQLDKFWNTTMTVTTDAQGGAAQVSWTEGGTATSTTTTTSTSDSTTSTTEGSTTTTSTPGSTTSTTEGSTTTTSTPASTTSTTEGSTTTTSTPASTTSTTAAATTTTTAPPATTTTTAPPATTSTTAASTTSTTRPSSTTSSSTSTSTTSTTLPAGTTISPTTVAPGGTVNITSTGWEPGGEEPLGEVVITLFSDPVELKVLKADATGKITGSVTIPANTPLGSHTLELAGFDPDGDERVVTAGITVVAPGSTTSTTKAGGTVPRTGSDLGPQLLIALLLVGAGGVLVEVARRRRLSS